jgi:hypothetical protein
MAAAATLVGWRMRRRFPQQEAATGGARGSGPYMARAGLISSGLFLFIILVQSLPILFYLRRC